MQGTGLVVAHTRGTEPHKRPVDLGSDTPALQTDSHAPVHIYPPQFRSLSAPLGSECGLSASPMRILLVAHTRGTYLHKRPVDLGSDTPTLQPDSHAPIHIYPPQFRSLSALLGSECGLSASPMRISLVAHTRGTEPHKRPVDLGSDAPTLQTKKNSGNPG